MTGILGLSLPEETIQCDAGGHAEAQITVTNTTGATFRVGHRLSTEHMTPSEWVSIMPPADTRLSPGESATYKVEIGVPLEASSRDHRFSVMFFDMAEPGERFVETPAIRFDAEAYVPPAPPPPPEPQKPRRSWILAVLLGLILTPLLSLIPFILLDPSSRGATEVALLLVFPFSALMLFAFTMAVRRKFSWASIIVGFQMMLVAGPSLYSFSGWAVLGTLLFIWAAWNFWKMWKATAHPTAPADADVA